MKYANVFFNFVMLDGKGVIGVDLNDGKGATLDKFKLWVAIRNVNKNGIFDFIFMFGAAFVGSEETGVNKSLTMFCEGDYVGDKWEVQEHVAIEN